MLAALLTGCGDKPPAPGQPKSADEFRREPIGMRLRGTPASGPLAGKSMCTVLLADGTAVLAGSGLLARGL